MNREDQNTSILKFNCFSREYHSIFSRKNHLQLYMRIAFKMNRIKKKVHHKIEIAFNCMKEIPLKITRSKKKSNLKLGLKSTL